MKTKLFFGENINGTNKTGIVKLVDNHPFLVCNCSKEDYILIKESFYPSPEIERLKEEIKELKAVVLLNHEHHIEYDDTDGYDGSDLFETNTMALEGSYRKGADK